MGALDWLTPGVEWYFRTTTLALFIYFVIINSTYLALIVIAGVSHARHVRREPFSGESDMSGSALSPGVSVLMPAFNESISISGSVRSVLDLRYPDHELIVINDGSTDGMLELLIAEYGLVRDLRVVPRRVPIREEIRAIWVSPGGSPRLSVIDKANSGVSDSINAGLNIASKDLVVMVDADSVIDPDALLKVSKPFADDPTRVVATGGVVRVVNGSSVVNGRVTSVAMPRHPLAMIQSAEYLRSFLLGRSGWSRLNALILISGAFGMFRRDVLLEVGGLEPDTLGQDFELVMSIHRWMTAQKGRDYRVVFVEDPVSWTEVPETLPQLARQRRRWHVGLWETLWKYRGMTFNPRYGAVGMIALPYYWAFELAAPVIEAVGFVLVPLGMILGVVNVPLALTLVAISYLFAAIVTLAAIATEESTFHRYGNWKDLWLLILAAIIENIGYRQIMVFWRVQAWLRAITGRSQTWGAQRRKGFGESAPVSPREAQR